MADTRPRRTIRKPDRLTKDLGYSDCPTNTQQALSARTESCGEEPVQEGQASLPGGDSTEGSGELLTEEASLPAPAKGRHKRKRLTELDK